MKKNIINLGFFILGLGSFLACKKPAIPDQDNGYGGVFGSGITGKEVEEGEKQISFPGADGYGKYTTGGRGGQVVEVTNLDDAGPGSFRDALSKFPTEPVTIVFKVSGIIELSSEIKISRSNLTIAGQTAPGDGICLKGHSFLINGGKNIIIRYIRSRPGSKNPEGVYAFGVENSENVMIDHCSFSWANEEIAAMYNVKWLTVQWSFVYEGLYNAGHAKGSRAYGGVWGGQYSSFHHNLVANLWSRAIQFSGAQIKDTNALIDYRNNVVYNWGKVNACNGGYVEINGGRSLTNMVNNYYKPGPATQNIQKFYTTAVYNAGFNYGYGRWHLSGNIMEGFADRTSNNWLGFNEESLPDAIKQASKSNTPFKMEEMETHTANEAYTLVLDKAGAILPKRDAADVRIVNEVRTNNPIGKGSYNRAGIIDDVSAVGGWPVYNFSETYVDTDKDGMPDTWEDANGLNKNDPTDRNTVHASGYTMLEMYLNSK